jgi:hypothetical protein
VVTYFTDQLHLFANDFGDLLEKETGKNRSGIHSNKLIDAAKDVR